MPTFQGKTVFITGANGAIGRATATRYAERGAQLFLTDVSLTGLPEHLSRLNTHPKAVTRTLNVMKSAEVRTAMQACADQFGAIDVLVANAGVFPRKAFVDITDEEWTRTFAINVEGVFYCCREVVPHMKAGGAIVALSSIAGHRGSRDHTHYAATKGAVLSMMRSLAWELAPDIRVNCVSPGPVSSPMIAELMEHRGDAILRQSPQGRLAEPDEIARAILFLTSDWASHITGTALHVNGGSYIAG